jgi:hypothetical protein
VNNFNRYVEEFGKQYASSFDGPSYPHDIEELRRRVPMLDALTDGAIDHLWREFSDQRYAAGWMNIDMVDMGLFKEWLNESAADNGSEVPFP